MTQRTTAIVCPGQGSQHLGMLDALPDRVRVERLLDAAEALADLDLRTVDRMGDAASLSETRVAQPLLYLSDWAWGISLLDAGLEPMAVAGHSLGEFAALALAGVFSVEAGLHLVVERSSLMTVSAMQHRGAMAAVLGLSPAEVAEATDGISDVWLANDNCPGQIVISGTKNGIEAASDALTAAGARRVVPLAVSGAFHSPLMEEAAEAFRHTLADAEFADATIPVVQNVAPEVPVTDGETIRENLSRQMTSPVRWTETMETLRALGVDVLVEAGPGSVLAGLAKRAEGVSGSSVETAGISAVLQEVGA